MNIHPIFVHFPIALLTVYAFFEMISWGKLQKNITWLWIKAALLWTGFLSAFPTLETGEMAEDLFGSSELLERHEFFGVASVWVFGVIAGLYAIFFLNQYLMHNSKQLSAQAEKGIKIINVVLFFFAQPWRFLFALAGFALLSIAGALGGALAHGPNADPVVRFIYDLFL